MSESPLGFPALPMHPVNPENEFHLNRIALVKNIDDISSIIEDFKIKCLNQNQNSYSFELRCPFEEVNSDKVY